MKKIFLKLSILIVIATSIVGCDDDFLNDPQPTDEVTSAVIFDSRDGADAFISGLMRILRAQYTRTDSGGLYSMYMARTVKGNDFIQNSWYNFDYDNDNREPNYTRTRFSWIYSYDIINQANTLINGIEASELPEIDKKELIGQGKALRAFFYFQLAMEFQHTYSYDSSLPAPPIYTELSLEGKPMSTLQEMYNLIIDDLTYATQNLSDARLGKSYINKAVANGFLARVYQVMENWPEAEKAANNAYGGGNVSSLLDPANYNDGFNDISNTEWIWGSPQINDQSNYYYVAPHAFTDHYADAYYGTYVNNDFVALFSDTDVRNTFQEAYPVPDTDYRNFITTKFSFSFDADMPYMRVPEMILVEAEAKYYNGSPENAHNLLYALQLNRDGNAVKSSNTGQALLDEILVERRKELYAEIGVEWFDAKRYRKGIPRTGNHRLLASDLQPDDKKFFLKIPQVEIDANDMIDDSVNADR